MTTYAMAEVRKNLSEILDKVINGERVVLTKYNIPVLEVILYKGDLRVVNLNE